MLRQIGKMDDFNVPYPVKDNTTPDVVPLIGMVHYRGRLAYPAFSGEAKYTNWSCYANFRLSMHSNRIMLCEYKIMYNILISSKTYP